MNGRLFSGRGRRIGWAATILAALPAGSGVAFLAAGRGQAMQVAIAVTIPTVVGAFAAIYRARQETERRQMELYPAAVLAAAVAKAIDCTHILPGGDVPSNETEAANVRAAALRFLSESSPEIVQQLGSPRDHEECS